MESKKIYTKLAVAFFSIFGSTVFGGILYIDNLKATDNKKAIGPTIIFLISYSLFYLFCSHKLELIYGIPDYFSFIPLNLILGLLLIGPFWNHQIGNTNNYERKKIWAPLIFLVIPILCLFAVYHFFPLKTKQQIFQENMQVEIAYQRENKIFVSQDSFITFYDVEIPVLESSYTYTTHVDDVTTLIYYTDFEDGRFLVSCIRVPLKESDEEYNLNLGDQFAIQPKKECSNTEITSMVCADFNKKDSTIGTVAQFTINRINYTFMTQVLEIEKNNADKISDYLISEIKSIPESKKELQKPIEK